MDKQGSILANSSTIQLVFYAFIIIFLWNWEALFYNDGFGNKWKHTTSNLWFIATALLVQLPLSILLIKVSSSASHNHSGLLNRLPHFIIVQLVVGFILLDFFDYVYHVLMHKIKICWTFHSIHHSDTKLDVSTTVREHPGETFCRVCFLIVYTYISGASILVLIVRQFVQSFSNIAAHTSMNLPEKAENILKYIFITPGLHKVHHHHELPYTDCNYGDVLSIWDRMFGTYKELDPSELRYGLDSFNEDPHSGFFKLIRAPFRGRSGSADV